MLQPTALRIVQLGHVGPVLMPQAGQALRIHPGSLQPADQKEFGKTSRLWPVLHGQV